MSTYVDWFSVELCPHLACLVSAVFDSDRVYIDCPTNRFVLIQTVDSQNHSFYSHSYLLCLHPDPVSCYSICSPSFSILCVCPISQFYLMQNLIEYIFVIKYYTPYNIRCTLFCHSLCVLIYHHHHINKTSKKKIYIFVFSTNQTEFSCVQTIIFRQFLT